MTIAMEFNMKIQKIIYIFLALCTILKADTETSGVLFPDIKKIIDKKKLVVAIYKEDVAPFYYTVDGKTVGLDVDLAKEIAKTIHPDIEVVVNRKPTSFNDVIDVVSKGEADVGISFLSYTAQRSRKTHYTKSPYIIVRTALLINRSLSAQYPEDSTLKKLFSKKYEHTICAVDGSSYVDMAKRIFPNVKLHLSKNGDQATQDLIAGKCHALLEDDFGIHKRLAIDPKLRLKYQPVTLEKELDPINIVISADFPNLANFIELYIKHSRKFPMSLNKVLRDNQDTYVKKED